MQIFWISASLIIFIMITLGGVVHNMGASLACPDWPLCFNEFFPKMEGLVAIEHSHRLLGAFIGMMFVGLNIYKFSRKHLMLLTLVILQGVFGGVTVLLQLSTLFSTLHLTLSLVFFFLVFREIEWNLTPEQSSRRLWQVIFVLVFVQVVYGALMRHLGLGLACGGGLNQFIFYCDFVAEEVKGYLHLIHRYYGYFLFLFLVFVTYKERKLSFFYKLPLIVTFFQVLLGVVTIITYISPTWTTLHLMVAVVLLCVLFLGIKKSFRD